MLNLSINTQGFNSFSRKVSPFLMFNNGAEGGLYPISDLKRQGQLYTDSALSTVLTDAGDPLGGAEDLSGNGNALTQATDTDRPVYGIVPFGGRRNLLTHTEDLGGSEWAYTAIDFVRDGNSITVNSTEGYGYLRESGSYSVSEHVFTVDVTCDTTVDNVGIRCSGDTSVLIDFVAGETQRVVLTEATPSSDRFELGVDNRDAVIPGSTDATGYTLTFDRVQLDEGSAATPYQKVVTQYEVTESGKQTAHVLHFNGTNQEIGSDYPAGTYTICLAGINGAWFDEIEHAGGAFDLGPTTFSSTNPDTDPDAPDRLYGPENMLETVGNLIAFVPMEGSISAAQKARLLQYLKQLGCPGEITLGDELVVNGTFDSDISAWSSGSSLTSTAVWDSGTIEVTATEDFGRQIQNLSLDTAAKYIAAADVKHSSGVYSTFVLGYDTELDSEKIGDDVTSATFVTRSEVFSPSNANVNVCLSQRTSGGVSYFDNVSVRKLEFPA